MTICTTWRYVDSHYVPEIRWPEIPTISIGILPLGIGHVMANPIHIYQHPIGRTILRNAVAFPTTHRSALLWTVVGHPNRHEGEQTRMGLSAAHAKVMSKENEALIVSAASVAAHVRLGLEALRGSGGGNFDGGIGQIDDAGGHMIDGISLADDGVGFGFD